MADMEQTMIQCKLAAVFDSAKSSIEDKLPRLWEDMFGNNETIIKEKLRTIEEVITTVVTEMIQEEELNRQEYRESYDKLVTEASLLEAELSIVVPRRDMASEPLLVRIKSLEADLKAHRKVREERMATLHRLQEKEEHFCTLLKDEPKYADFNSVPSVATLVEIENHIKSLQATLTARQEQYSSLREQVINLWASLELAPEDSFEHQVKNDDMSELTGADDLARLEILLNKLENSEDQMKEELENLRYQLSILWTRLNTSAREREKFLQANNRLCGRTLNAFKEQIKVCTALKLTRIKEIVGAVRDELSDWWQRAHFGQEQMDEFVEFKLEHDITEEVLVKHELEVERVKQYFEENREIFSLLELRFNLWEDWMLLENKANDKDRLFSNRGGQLLVEEKRRKCLQKELPKVEKKLEKLLDAYEARTGQNFLYEGEDAREMMARQWESRNKSKENLKQAKKVAATPSKTQPRLLAVTQNLTVGQTAYRSANLKRKGDGTPFVEAKKRVLNSTAKQTEEASRACLPEETGRSPTPSLTYSMFQHQLNGASNSTYDVNSPSHIAKAVRSTPLVQTSKVPTRSKLISPKVKSKLPVTRTPGVPKLRRSRSHLTLASQVGSTLTRTRSQAQLSFNPRSKPLPFIF